ncbi:M56 family metallopeptidase [Nocardioides panacisoli]|uniref:M56 family metallopeptidase n=1 Tax=Nocardioides panacisoli TaxID=627624 RepID=UPI001C62AF9C|nr:M56 family metallopeptidase [Nocardioides panacisoli]QYJ05418.1 M56 family metallopeptidase [Nocardioides panacisoli]
MTAVALLAYVLVVGGVGHRLARRATWLERAPRVGILAWQALTYSVVLAAALAGAALWLPALPGTESLAHFLNSCVAMVRQQYATPGGAIATTAGGVLVVAVVTRALTALVRRWVRVSRGRAEQRRQLSVLARSRVARDVVVVEHDRPAAYCLPGRHSTVVVTSSAVECLTDDELEAVLAHERAHLRGRHDLVVASSAALADAFGFLPLFRCGATEVARLIELRADDVAQRRTGRLTLARALVRLAGSAAPVGALGAGGPDTVRRVRRLVHPVEGIGVLRATAVLGTGMALLAFPVAMALLPAVMAMYATYCPLPMA